MLALLLCGSVAAAPSSGSPERLLARARPALDAIRPDAISAHVRFLSDDLLEGRRSGERGHALAERYVFAQLQALGVQPVYQDVPMKQAKLDRQRTAFELGAPGELQLERDYVVSGDGESEHREIEAPLVFVGYGVRAPEYGWDDLRDADLRGKIAVVLSGVPESFPPLGRAFYSSGKSEELRARGAVAIVSLTTAETDKRVPWSFATRGFHSGRTSVDGGRPALPTATIALAAVPKVLSGKKLLFERARLSFAAAYRSFTARNVIGTLPATVPGSSAGEAIAYSAHLDHLGVGEPVNGDAIYNGAIDNALGIADLLEIARGFSALGERRRSVMFIAFTGEELGLLGSDWFVRHPTVPLERIVANLNMDQLLPRSRPKDVVLRGAELSSLEENVRAAAGALGIAVSDDPVPEQVFFSRSDQYNFAREGVPSACLWQGFAGGGEKFFREFRATRYHQPQDQWEPGAFYDWEAAAEMARLELLTGVSVMDAAASPRWKPGSFFERRR